MGLGIGDMANAASKGVCVGGDEHRATPLLLPCGLGMVVVGGYGHWATAP
jgi:hypothetical protein